MLNIFVGDGESTPKVDLAGFARPKVPPNATGMRDYTAGPDVTAQNVRQEDGQLGGTLERDRKLSSSRRRCLWHEETHVKAQNSERHGRQNIASGIGPCRAAGEARLGLADLQIKVSMLLCLEGRAVSTLPRPPEVSR